MRLPTFYEQNLIPNWGNIAKKESKHHVKPCANVQGAAKAVAHSKGGKHGGVYGGADKVHLTALGVGSLNVVDSHREKREARQVDQHIDDGSHIFVRGAEAEVHLQEEVYRHKKQGCEYHPARPLIPPVYPSHVKTRDGNEECADKHEYQTCKL